LGFDTAYGDNARHACDGTTEERLLLDASSLQASTSSHSSISLPAKFTQSHVSYREGHLTLHADCGYRYEDKRATQCLTTGLHHIQGDDGHITAKNKLYYYYYYYYYYLTQLSFRSVAAVQLSIHIHKRYNKNTIKTL
jgi:hypothetical protein